MKKCKPGWLVLVLFFSGIPAFKVFAQTAISRKPLYRNFTSINSDLPSDIVYKIITDNYGYLWMATERGMVRYNGSSFRKYVAPSTDNEFIQVYKSADSLLWLFGYSGNCRLLNLNTHTFSSVLNDPENPAFKSPVILAYQKSDTLSLYRINSTFSQVALSHSQQQRSEDKVSFISSLLTDWRVPDNSKGQLADTLLSLFKNKPYAIQITGNILIPGNKIFQRRPGAPAALIFDGDREKLFNNISSYARIGNDLYLGFVEAQELLAIKNYFIPGNHSKSTFTRILTEVPVTSLAADYQGNLWVGSLGNGVYLFTPADLATRHFSVMPVKDNENTGHISGINLLNNGYIAIGHNRDRISFLFENKLENISITSQRSLNEIRAVYTVNNNWFFFGKQNSYMGSGKALPRKFIPLPVSSHTPFKDGVQHNGKYYFTTKTACFIINSNGGISVDHRQKGNNTLSIAPLNDSICFYGTSDGIYRNNIPQPFLRNDRINKLRVVNNVLVVCTQQGAFRIPIDKNGELGNAVQILKQNCYDVKSNARYCYIRTGTGLVLFNIQNWKLCNEFDGKKYSFSINDFLIKNDSLIFAAGNDIFELPEQDISAFKNNIQPRIFLTSSLTGYTPSERISEIRFSKKLSVSLLVDILDFTNEARESSYQINYNGDEISSWQILNGPTITLNNLRPGKYKVAVRTTGLYSGIQNTALHTIIVQPLWYQENWVHILLWSMLAIVISLVVFLLYRSQLKKAKKKMNDQIRMNELESRNLFDQLKPHFIFNVLTPLQSYFINGDDIGGLEYIDNYAKLMRGFLQESRESYISIAKEIDFLKHYLFVQQRRFNNSFTYYFEIAPTLNIENLYIPTLLLQPIVENAIEHGVKGEDCIEGKITIRMETKANVLLISVIDNGKGLNPGKIFLKPDHALQIIQERLELNRVKHKVGTMNIHSNSNTTGTIVMIELPLLTTQP